MIVDAPGHGEAGDVRVDLTAGAQLLGVTGERATYVGYSMGGRLALHLAVAKPDLVERLVLVSSTAGLRTDDERASRQVEDERRAADIEQRGVAAFLETWLDQPLFANLPPDATQLADRLDNAPSRVGVEPAACRHRCPTIAVARPAVALDARATRRRSPRRQVRERSPNRWRR